MTRKTNKMINAALIVVLITAFAKVAGFLRDIFIANIFGTGYDSDVYFMSIKITTTIFMAIASAISIAMLPILKSYKINKQAKEADQYTSKILNLGVLFSLGIMVLFYLFTPHFVQFIARGFVDEKLAKTVELTYILTPTILFITLTYVVKGLLQANEKFFVYSITSLPFNLILVVYLAFFAPQYGISGLAVATLIGWVSQFAIQLPTAFFNIRYRYHLNFDFFNEEIKKFMVLLLPIFLSTAVYTINTLVDSSIASRLSEGKLAGLNYGYIIYSSIVTTIIVGITTVLFPKFIETNEKSEEGKLKTEIEKSLNTMLYIAAPIMVFLILFSRPLIEIAYMRGEFNERSVQLTQFSFIFYTVGTIGYTFNEVLNKAFFAIKNSKIPMMVSIVMVSINVILDVVLSKYLDYIGLALATSIAVTVTVPILYLILQKKVGRIKVLRLGVSFIKIGIILTALSYMANFILQRFYITAGNLFINLGVLFLTGVLSAILYILITYLSRIDEAKYLVHHYLKLKKKEG